MKLELSDSRFIYLGIRLIQCFLNLLGLILAFPLYIALL